MDLNNVMFWLDYLNHLHSDKVRVKDNFYGCLIIEENL